MSFRNQSPPPEYVESNNDKIGTSCYSELWLYKLLMDLLRFVCENKNSQEVEKKIEEDLCTLWDMTVDKELIKDLRQFDLIEVFSKVLVENNFSRLTEIIFGILANLASDNEMCREISENEELTWIILGSLNDRDIPVLNETCRVIHTVIASEEHRKNWTQKIHFQENVHDNLIFILRSSLNVALLKNSLHLTDALITEDDSLAEIWCDLPLLNAIIEADKQLR